MKRRPRMRREGMQRNRFMFNDTFQRKKSKRLKKTSRLAGNTQVKTSKTRGDEGTAIRKKKKLEKSKAARKGKDWDKKKEEN